MRKCFTCKQEISLQDAIEGQKITDIIGENFLSSENAKGDEKVKEDDKELLEALKDSPNNVIGSILLHPDCIKKDLLEYYDWLAERGREDR